MKYALPSKKKLNPFHIKFGQKEFKNITSSGVRNKRE
jgi:hypothetical protein